MATGPRMSSVEMDAFASLAQVRAETAEAERLACLGSPEAFMGAAGHMEVAIAAFAKFQELTDAGSKARQVEYSSQLFEIRDRVGRLGGLMSAAAEFHAGWARIAASRVSAYGPDGVELGLPAEAGVGIRCDASG